MKQKIMIVPFFSVITLTNKIMIIIKTSLKIKTLSQKINTILIIQQILIIQIKLVIIIII